MWLFSRRPNIERLVARQDVAGLTRLLAARDPAQRQAAAQALSRCPPAAAAPPLLAALSDSMAAVRAAAIEALAALDDAAVVTALNQRLVARSSERESVLAALGRLANHPAALAAVVDRLQHGAPAERAAAATALARRGDRLVVPPLLAALADDEPTVVTAASAALVVVGADRVLAPLTEALTGVVPAVRAAAATILGQLSDARSVTALAEALGDAQPAVRQAALAAIEQLPEPGRQIALLAGISTDVVERERAAQRLRGLGTLGPLAALLRAVDHPGLRAAAVRAIGRLGEAGSVAVLRAALTDPEPAVCQEAAWMLGVSGQPAALDPLLAVLATGGEAGLRAAAARALGRLGLAAAGPALASAQADPDPGVATAARRALASLEERAVGAADEPAALPPGAPLQVVLFVSAATPADRADYASQLLDQNLPAALGGATDIQIVVMASGQPVPDETAARLIVRRQFMTPPAGYAWQAQQLADAAGRSVLLLQLSALSG